MILVSLCCVVVTTIPGADELRPLFDAIRAAETGGSLNSANAVGDHGGSIGPYQISRKYWMDSGMRGNWQSCRDAAVAERAMLSYWRRHCPEVLRQQDFEVLARIHNGGPQGHHKKATLRYWRVVQHALRDDARQAG